MRSVVELNEAVSIVHLQWNPADGTDTISDLITLKNYDEKEILYYLSSCKEELSRRKPGMFLSSEVQLAIYVHTEEGLKQILLGDVNRGYMMGEGSKIYLIQNPEEVSRNLIQILHLSEE